MGKKASTMFKCISCGNSDADTRTLADAKDSDKIEVALCQTCGLVQLVRVPGRNELTDYYRSEYRLDYKGANAPKPHHVYRAGKIAVDRLEKIKKFIAPGASVLDIGAGGGEFVFLAGEMGFDASGIDPSAGYIEHAREMYGADLRSIAIEDLEAEKTYDLITLFHVLEHLPDPGGAVKAIARHLEKDGHLFIEVPDFGSQETSPYNFFHKAHVSYFIDRTLIELMREDFEICDVNTGRALQVIGKKRETPAVADDSTLSRLRSEALRVSRKRWEGKNLKEYLMHGAMKSPFRKVARMTRERSRSRGKTSREILESFLKQPR